MFSKSDNKWNVIMLTCFTFSDATKDAYSKLETLVFLLTPELFNTFYWKYNCLYVLIVIVFII